MTPRAIENLMTRLLKLEQRFDSYCDLHEDELEEIKAALTQLREDVLRLSQESGMGIDEDASLPNQREASEESVSFSDGMSI